MKRKKFKEFMEKEAGERDGGDKRKSGKVELLTWRYLYFIETQARTSDVKVSSSYKDDQVGNRRQLFSPCPAWSTPVVMWTADWPAAGAVWEERPTKSPRGPVTVRTNRSKSKTLASLIFQSRDA
ncbi:hypothetical protein RRG08_003993 [Elysia crispata]|uniref:Uncharacterized protein n=1 Tax=Elysia crispata TaxID=231223 RepID=A0AAE0Y5B7_9GAST|nr:hypothetical protein RRG08_003993 [Elysia crispata]